MLGRIGWRWVGLYPSPESLKCDHSAWGMGLFCQHFVNPISFTIKHAQTAWWSIIRRRHDMMIWLPWYPLLTTLRLYVIYLHWALGCSWNGSFHVKTLWLWQPCRRAYAYTHTYCIRVQARAGSWNAARITETTASTVSKCRLQQSLTLAARVIILLSGQTSNELKTRGSAVGVV